MPHAELLQMNGQTRGDGINLTIGIRAVFIDNRRILRTLCRLTLQNVYYGFVFVTGQALSLSQCPQRLFFLFRDQRQLRDALLRYSLCQRLCQTGNGLRQGHDILRRIEAAVVFKGQLIAGPLRQDLQDQRGLGCIELQGKFLCCIVCRCALTDNSALIGKQDIRLHAMTLCQTRERILIPFNGCEQLPVHLLHSLTDRLLLCLAHDRQGLHEHAHRICHGC